MKIGSLRVSRPCYDKYHRCPGWAGPGLRFNKPGRDWCEGGSLAPFGGAYYKEDGTMRGKHWQLWRVNRCPKCGVYVLPYHVRWLDWRWLRFWLAWKVSDWQYEFSVKDEYNAVEWWLYCHVSWLRGNAKEDA